jgi:hypothetical protein
MKLPPKPTSQSLKPAGLRRPSLQQLCTPQPRILRTFNQMKSASLMMRNHKQTVMAATMSLVLPRELLVMRLVVPRNLARVMIARKRIGSEKLPRDD